jgi:probable LLM family oxidoreductase
LTARPLELGLDTFGDVTRDGDGRALSHAEVLRNLVEQAALADRLGVDFFGVGEHHRADFAVSAPEVALAAIAARTQRIRLGSAVTVLSSDDPVRVFERFATLDGLSNGRAEVIVGRGSFTESFALFGCDLSQYEELFEEKLELFVALLRQEKVTWRGRLRAPLVGQRVFPRPQGATIKTWIGVGGTPESVIRAARHRLPLMLAIIGGPPLRFRPYADLYRRALAQGGVEAAEIGAHSPGYVGETDAAARDEFYPDYKAMRDHIGAERGWGPLGRDEYEREIAEGALYVGSPETVAAKIAATARGLGLSRFDLKYSAGGLSHARMMSCIELYAREAIPRVRRLIGEA